MSLSPTAQSPSDDADARWCDGGRTQRSRVGSLTDKAVKSSKRRAAEASLDKVVIGSDPPLEYVPNFDYLGSRLQGDGSDDADVPCAFSGRVVW